MRFVQLNDQKAATAMMWNTIKTMHVTTLSLLYRDAGDGAATVSMLSPRLGW